MKKKDKEAFLKSVFGASPIKKKNKIKKEIHRKERVVLQKQTTRDFLNKDFKKIKPKSVFVLEKSNINKKLKKGKIQIDRKVDFHGLSVLDAEELFLNTIINCYSQNLRCILFVTGKGIFNKNISNNKNAKLYYGKIRENFFIWIKKLEFQKYILSFEQANFENGGDGAFFVYLRKNI